MGTEQPMTARPIMNWHIFRHLASIIILISLSVSVWAQQSLEIIGAVKDGVKGMPDVKVTLMKDNKVVRHVSTNSGGKFNFSFDANADYLIIVSKDGFVTKSIAFNTRVPSEAGPTWDFDFIVELFRDMPGLDKGVYRNPVAKVYFNKAINDFDYDLDYAMDFQKREQEVKKQIEELQVNKEKEEKAKQAAAAQALKDQEKAAADKAKQEAAQLKEKQTRFEQMLAAAEASVKQQKYDDALAKLKEAEQLFPEDFRPTQRSEEITALKEAAAAKADEQKAKEDRFAKLKAEADQSYVTGDLKEAKAQYQEALKVKADAKEITDIIKQIDGQLAQKAKEAEEQKKRQGEIEQMIRVGDEQFKAGRFADAKGTFQKAAVLAPDDQRIQNRITESTARLEEESRKQAQNQARQKEFEQIVAEAAKAEKAGDLAKANENYTNAAQILPESPIARDGVARTTAAIAAKAKEEEEKRRITEQYDALVAEAQKMIAAAQYDEAVRKLEQADVVKPGNKDLNKLMAQARAGADEARKKAAEEMAIGKQFAAAMSEGRVAMERKELDGAIAAFTKATKLKPDDADAKSALQNAIDTKSALAKAEEEKRGKEQRYIKLLQEGEAAIMADDFSKAEGIYVSAVELMPERTEASVQLVKIRSELERRKRAEEEALKRKTDVEALFAEAEKLFNQQNHEGAKLTYKRVLDLDKEHAASAARIKEIDELLARLEWEQKAKKEAQEAYDRFMAAGNEALSAKRYDKARDAYASAAQALPESTEPARKIAEIEEALAQIRAAEDAQLERDQKYVDEVMKAEEQYKAEQLEEAIVTFRSASTLKPNEKLPIKRIAEIEAILAEKKKEEERKRADELAQQQAEQARLREAEEKQRLDAERARLEEERKRAEGEAVRLAEVERQKQIEEAKAKELERQRKEQEQRVLEFQAKEAQRLQFEEAEKSRLALEAERERAEREKKAAAEAEAARLAAEEEARKEARLRAEQEETLRKQELEKQKLQEDLDRTAEEDAKRMEAEAEAIMKKRMEEAEARMRAEVEAKLRKEFEQQYEREVKAAELARQAELAKAAQVARDQELAERERIKEEQNAETQRIARAKAEEEERKRQEEEMRLRMEAERVAMEAKLKAEQERLDRQEAELKLKAEQARIEAEKLAARAAELEARKLREEEERRVALEAAEKAKFAAEQERLAREEAQRIADDKKREEARLKAEEERIKLEEEAAKKRFAAEQYAAAAKEREAREKQLAEEKERIRKEEIAQKEKNYKDKIEFEKKSVEIAKQSAAEARGGYEDDVRKKLQAEYDAKRATLGLEEVKKNTEDALKAKPSAFQQDLATKYPKGITEERDVKPNQEITIIVVNRGDGFPNEFRKVRWNWGGVYFFKNGESTSKQIFETETKW